MESLLHDISYGFRSLAKQPGFTAIVLLTLGLGIGASSAIFSVVNSVLLRDLPYRQAERIVAIQELSPEGRRARRYYANQNPVGRTLQIGTHTPPREIIGVARTAKYRNLREDPLPFVYIPLAQEYQSGMALMVRTEGDPAALISLLRNEVRALTRRNSLFTVETMTEQIRGELAADRMIATLLSIFGVAALLLAAIGVYGVISYSVAQSTHEIGIRMALGADRGDIVRLIVWQGLTLVVIGTGIGLFLSLGLMQLLKSLLFGISATDPFTLAAVVALMMVVGLFASYMPARRATKVDPLEALRYE